jgi:hypothetical protein
MHCGTKIQFQASVTLERDKLQHRRQIRPLLLPYTDDFLGRVEAHDELRLSKRAHILLDFAPFHAERRLWLIEGES